jgi:hypothetical protein
MAFTDAEKETLLEILALRADTGTAERTTFETALTAAEAIPGREDRIRTYLVDWADIPKEPVKIDGGPKAMTYTTSEHRLFVRNEIAVALGYPVMTLVEYDTATQGFTVVQITLNGLYSSGSEWA